MKAEGGRQKAESGRPRVTWSIRRLAVILLYAAFSVDHSAGAAAAAASPDDVFRSISDNAGPRGESGHATALLLCAAGGLILLLLLGTRARRQAAAPQALNHSRKLMREVMKAVPLRRAELKQLRLLADSCAAGGADGNGGGSAGARGEPVQSPLTLLLCPSLLARALKNRPPKVDRAVIARIVRKMNLAPQEQAPSRAAGAGNVA